jgi:hypothetical protein
MGQKPEYDLQQLNERLMQRWILWGLVPLAVCTVAVLIASRTAPPGLVQGKQQVRLVFEVVLGFGAGVFLAAFYIDGRWTSSDRVARRVFSAAGADMSRSPSSWAQSSSHRARLREKSDIALRTVAASAETMTLLGSLIGIAAIVAVVIGLGVAHAAQILLLGLFYHLFLFSRHPYYQRIVDAATRGELIPPDEKDDDGNKDRAR